MSAPHRLLPQISGKVLDGLKRAPSQPGATETPAVKIVTPSDKKNSRATTHRPPASPEQALAGCNVLAGRKAPPPTGGNRAYAGYDYQIWVTAWIALDLMLVKEVCEAVVIEPPSQEDLEAKLNPIAPETSVRLSGTVARKRLLVQIKSRSRSPWTSREFAQILQPSVGKTPSQAARPNGGRAAPLDILCADPSAQYLFVTNEALEAPLRAFGVSELLGSHDSAQLPPFVRRDLAQADSAALAPRILIYPNLTLELLEARIRHTLSQFGHVPEADHLACIKALREEICARLLGQSQGAWRRDDLIQLLRRHNGSLFALRALEHFVPPKPFDAILQRLEQDHAVLIDGRPGIGKTLTAEVIEARLRQAVPPFTVITEQGGPGAVRAHLHEPFPVLFHLRDPWGSNWLESGADRWANELPGLLEERSATRKFLITSRTDVLRSAGQTLAQRLKRFVVTLDTQDYDEGRLERIFESRCQALAPPRQFFAQNHRRQALHQLRTPYELDRFFVALAQDMPLNIDTLVGQSHIEAIAGVVADQVRYWQGSRGGVTCAAFLWGMIRARGEIESAWLERLPRMMRQLDGHLTLEVGAFVDFFTAGRNLRREPSGVTFFHPRVQAGFQMALVTQSGEAERVMALLLQVLGDANTCGQWGIETAMGLLRALSSMPELRPPIHPQTQHGIDAYLWETVVKSDAIGFAYALADLALWGSAHDGPATVARSISRLLALPTMPAADSTFSPASALASAHLTPLRDDIRVGSLLQRIIVELLPLSATLTGIDFVKSLDVFGHDLTASYRKALLEVAHDRYPQANVDVLVQGALRHAPVSEFDEIIATLASIASAADQDYARTETLAWDPDHTRDTESVPPVGSYNAEAALDAIVTLRSWWEEGLGWILPHPHRAALTSSAVGLLEHKSAPPSATELRTLIAAAAETPSVRIAVWRLVAQHWDPALLDLLDSWLCRDDLSESDVRATLLRLSATQWWNRPRWMAYMSERLLAAAPARQLELIQDIADCSYRFPRSREKASGWRQRAETLAATLQPPLAELALALLASLEGFGEAAGARLSESAQECLVSMLPAMPPWTARLFLSALAGCGMSALDGLRAFLATGQLEDGTCAVDALSLLPIERSATLWRACLDHPQPTVRQRALAFAVEHPSISDRSTLIGSSRDRSALVRLEFAKLMAVHRWPEAIGPLGERLADTHDFPAPAHQGTTDSRDDRVARAAAYALSSYEALPREALATLLRAVKNGRRLTGRQRSDEAASGDPHLLGSVLYALTCLDDRLGLTALLSVLCYSDDQTQVFDSGALLVMLADEQRITLTDVLRKRLLKYVTQSSALGLAPVLVALGRLDDPIRATLLHELPQLDSPACLELLTISAAGARVPCDAVDRKLIDSLLARARKLGSLTQASPGHRRPSSAMLFWREVYRQLGELPDEMWSSLTYVAAATSFLAARMAAVPIDAAAVPWLEITTPSESTSWRVDMATAWVDPTTLYSVLSKLAR